MHDDEAAMHQREGEYPFRIYTAIRHSDSFDNFPELRSLFISVHLTIGVPCKKAATRALLQASGRHRIVHGWAGVCRLISPVIIFTSDTKMHDAAAVERPCDYHGTEASLAIGMPLVTVSQKS